VTAAFHPPELNYKSRRIKNIMAERLHRLEQVYIRHPIYFVTLCTHDRKALLANRVIHDAFNAFCQKAMERQIFPGRYVLMPDHLHLFVSITEGGLLSNWIKSLKNSLSKTLNEAGFNAPHWQKGFFDHILRSGESYSEKWLYVVENPVRAGLTRNWEEWPWQGEIHPLRFD
jgi:putative transposase